MKKPNLGELCLIGSIASPLLCVVSSLFDDEIHFYVVNGAWFGIYNMSTGIMTVNANKIDKVEYTTGIELLSVAQPPKNIIGYNEQIAWYRDQLGIKP